MKTKTDHLKSQTQVYNLALTFINIVIGTKMITAIRKHRICYLQFLDNTDEIGL